MKELNKFVTSVMAFLMLVAGSMPAPAQAQAAQPKPANVPELLAAANKAYTDGDYAALGSALEHIHQARPYNSEYMYRLVLAYALQDKKSLAYDLMLRMQQQGLAYDFTLSDDSRNIRGTEVFDYVNDLMKQAAKPMGEATPVLTLPEAVIMPESLAWDPTRQKYLAGTVVEGQVLAVDEQGRIEELLKADSENGMWAVLDILVDEARGRLWVSSAAIPGFLGFSPVDKGRSALYEFDLESLELMHRYPVPVDGRPHVLGNMVMNPAGDIFVADRTLPFVFTKPAGEQKLEAVIASRDMISLRGMAMQPDGRILYMADREMGILVVDLVAKRAAKLAIPETLNLGGIDGMYLWNNNLVIIQNGIAPQRVMRLNLDASGTRVEAVRPLAVAQPAFDFPSFGMIKGEELFYFANSHWADSGEAAKPVTVVRTALNSSEDLLPPEMMLYLEKQKQAAGQQEATDKN
jgi:sugar lactone lactonase YvrE